MPARSTGPESVPLDEDALPGALLGSLHRGLFEVLGHECHPRRAAGFVLDRVAFLHVGETVVEQGEHSRRDLLTEPVTGAQILIDPDLHREICLPCVRPPSRAEGPDGEERTTLPTCRSGADARSSSPLMLVRAGWRPAVRPARPAVRPAGSPVRR